MNIVQQITETINSIAPLDKREEEHLFFTSKWITSGAEIFRIAKPATVPKNVFKRVYFLFRSLSDRPVCEISLCRL